MAGEGPSARGNWQRRSPRGAREEGYGIGANAVDANGDAYVTGSTYSLDFPVTPGAYQALNNARGNFASNIFVTKVNPNGTGLVYSTYLGGSGVPHICYVQGYLGGGTVDPYYLPATEVGDAPTGIALDSAGDAYIVGNSASLDYPTTPGAFQATNNTGGPSRRA